MRSRVVEFCRRVGEYSLFLVLTLVVWSYGDLVRFAVARRKPGLEEIAWVACGYSIVWLLAGLFREQVGGLVTRVAESRKEETETVQGGAVTSQEA